MENEKPTVEGQYKTLVVIWAALLMSQFLFVLMIFLTRPQLFTLEFSQPIFTPSAGTVIGFSAAAVTAVILSFAFRKRLNERAVAEQDTVQVQTALIIALALCEASSLFGLALAFGFEYQYFFVWIILGIAAMILHFPKRDAIHAASYKK